MKKPVHFVITMLLVLCSVIVNPAPAADAVTERMQTDALMMPYYTGNIMPTPQQVEYRDEFVSMDNVAIVVGKDVENPDPLVDVLVDRITRYGGRAAVVNAPGKGHTAVISLGVTGLSGQAKGLPSLPDREQGYVLHAIADSDRPLIVLQGYDRLGLLWAISSLTQLIHLRDDRTVARAVSVADYPYLVNRGYLSNALPIFHTPRGGSDKGKKPDTDQLLKNSRQFNVAFKFNMPRYGFIGGWFGNHLDPENGYWRTPEKWAPEKRGFPADMINPLGALFKPLGITWLGSVHPHTGAPEDKLCGNKETIQALLWFARRIEEAGGHMTIQLDDVRFPMNPYDVEHFGSACEADTYVITNLMARLKQEYPGARLVVCPPFYWGPGGKVDYDESRTAYLKTIGDRWQPEIDIFWTGSRINGTPLATKESVEWITGLIKRKPFFWQNSALTWNHAYFFHYGTDPVNNFRVFYWDGFLEAVGWFGVNSHMPEHYTVVAVSSDFLWNPKAHDPDKAIREAVGKVLGPDVWDVLDRYNASISYFDRYYVRGRAHTPEELRGAARNIRCLEAKTAEMQAALKEMQERFPMMSHWSDYKHFAGIWARFVARIRFDRDGRLRLYLAAADQETLAEKAGDYDPDRDIFLAACDFEGGLLSETKDVLTDKPSVSHVLNEALGKCRAEFQLDDGASGGPGELWLCAVLGGDPASVTITLNGRELFNGSKALNEMDWTTLHMPVPEGLLRTGTNKNLLVVETRETEDAEETIGLSDDDADSGRESARLIIRYAVLKQVDS